MTLIATKPHEAELYPFPFCLPFTNNRDKIIHKQLAKAGVRLAAVLNTLLLPADAEAP